MLIINNENTVIYNKFNTMDDAILNERAILKGNVSIWSRLDVGGLAMFGTTVSFADGSTHGSYLKTSEASTTLNSIINISSSQSASINSILTTIPSYLQSATADATFATIANPVFSGTVTAPTINAKTTLQVGGITTAILYASKPWVQCRKSNSHFCEEVGSSSGCLGH